MSEQRTHSWEDLRRIIENPDLGAHLGRDGLHDLVLDLARELMDLKEHVPTLTGALGVALDEWQRHVDRDWDLPDVDEESARIDELRKLLPRKLVEPRGKSAAQAQLDAIAARREIREHLVADAWRPSDVVR